MSKVTRSKLFSIVAKYKNDFIETDGLVVKCSLCEVPIKIDDRHNSDRIIQHLSCQRHKDLTAKAQDKKQKQQFLTTNVLQSGSSGQKLFCVDLTRALVESGIPIFKVNSTPFRQFLEKYTSHHIPDESLIRKNYVKTIYDETIEKIKLQVGNSPICLIFDETTDVSQHYVLNVLVMPLNSTPIKPMLFKMFSLERTNNSTVMQSIIESCSFLWNGIIQYEKLWLAVTDQASYMILALSNLKPMFPNLHQVTCLAHGLHRVAETIRDEYSTANQYISSMGKILLKAPARIQLFKELTSLPIPPDPVVTRWGTWIKSATFYCENFRKIVEFVNAVANDSKSCETAKQLVSSDVLKDELFNAAMFKLLTGAIETLETRNFKKEEQWKIFMEAGEMLTGFAREKFDASLRKNRDIKRFVENNDPEFRLKTLYAPLVSVEAERSFSQYKMILSDRRRRLTFENIEMLNVVAFNKFASISDEDDDVME